MCRTVGTVDMHVCIVYDCVCTCTCIYTYVQLFIVSLKRWEWPVHKAMLMYVLSIITHHIHLHIEGEVLWSGGLVLSEVLNKLHLLRHKQEVNIN